MYQLYFSYFRRLWWLWFYGSWIYKYNVPVQSMSITTKHCEFESSWWRGVLDTTLGDTVCQRLLPDWWFSQTWSHNVVSSTSHHERSSNWQLKYALIAQVTINAATMMAPYVIDKLDHIYIQYIHTLSENI